LSSTGILFNASYNHTEAYPGGVVAPLGIISKGDFGSVGLSYPVFGTARASLIESFSYDATNSRAFILNGVMTSSDERTRALRLGSNFTLVDGLGGTTTANIVVGQGLDVMGARPQGNQPNSRPGSTLEFTKVRFDILRQQPLPDSFALQLGLSGQRAFSPLPSAELYSFGGALYGRAYDGGIIAGDHGIAAKAELSRTILVGLPLLQIVQPLVFYDFGATEYSIPIAGLQKRATAASAGVGSRFIILPWLGGLVEFDRPLTRQAVNLTGEKSKDLRVFFSLAAQY
jgi:hemolysin activation/secretion protein